MKDKILLTPNGDRKQDQRKLKHLVLCHVETAYLNIHKSNRKGAQRMKGIFEKIAQEVESGLERGERVYYLTMEADSWGSRHIYPPLRKHREKIRLITVPPGAIMEYTFLQVKEELIACKAEKIEVAGMVYGACVSDLWQLLNGVENKMESKEWYRNATKPFGWSRKKFEFVYGTNLNAVLREDLTDK